MKTFVAVVALLVIAFGAPTWACNTTLIFNESLKVCALWESSWKLPFFPLPSWNPTGSSFPSFSLSNIKSYCESIDKNLDYFLSTFDPLTDLTCKFVKDLCSTCTDKVSISSSGIAGTTLNETASSG